MTYVNFKYGYKKYLPQEIKNGSFLVATDTGELFVDIENRRITIGGLGANGYAPNSMVFGASNRVGTRAFTIKSFTGEKGKQGTFTLSNTKTPEDKRIEEIEEQYYQLNVGDIYSIEVNGNYEDCGVITAINDNVVTVDNMYLDSNIITTLPKEAYFFIIDKPLCGDTEFFGEDAVAFGANNKALKQGAFVTGLENIAAGKYSLVSGRKNRAGVYSQVSGYNNKAMGHANIVGGQLNNVSGWYCLVGGENNDIRGNNNMAIGANNIIYGGYWNSLIVGSSNKIGNNNLGYEETPLNYILINGFQNKAIGEYLLINGSENEITGNYMAAIGYKNKGMGQYNSLLGIANKQLSDNNFNLIIGDYNSNDGAHNIINGAAGTITGSYNLVIGPNTTHTGSYGIVLGNKNTGQGNGIAVFGSFNKALADGATAIGANNTASGECSFAGGYGASSGGRWSFAWGWSAHASVQNAVAIGGAASASADSAFSIGYGITTTKRYQIGLGVFNDCAVVNKNNSFALLTVGYGSSEQKRANNFVVYADGTAEIVKTGESNNSLVTKEYVDKAIQQVLAQLNQ